MSRELLAPYTHYLRVGSTLRWTGRITQVVGNLIESEGPFCSVGESCTFAGQNGRSCSGEIIGFRGEWYKPIKPTLRVRLHNWLISIGDRHNQTEVR